jgi:putative peptidoglycan lipid II flippase
MKSMAKAIGLVMIIMLFSRLLSLVSNQVYITFFGINLYMDIYSYATQLPNIIFNSLGTAITTVMIPVFAGYIGTGEKERAFKFADNITSLSSVFTLILSGLAMLAAPFIIRLTRFSENGYDFAVTALRIMFPVMVFYALNYIFQGILQSLGRYNMPAFVSVPSSLVVIGYVAFFGERYGVRGLLTATFIGLSLQALILIPPILKTGYRYRPSFNYRDEDVRKALRLIPPILIGTSAYQLNMLFNTTLAANFKDAIAIMVTVQNLILYAVLAFIYSITAVVFPRFTMLAARNEMEGFKHSLQKVLKSVTYFLIPATFGFIAVRHQLVNFLYGWGRVTSDNVSLGSGIFALYALGVTGIGIKEVIDRAFYSLKDTRRPAYNGVIIMCVNIALSLILITFIGVLGIPLANSISSITGAVVLFIMLRKKIGAFGGAGIAVSAAKAAAASVLMLGVVILINFSFSSFSFGTEVLDRAVKLFVPSAAGAFVYFAATCAMKVEEAVDILGRVRGRLPLKRI